MEHTELYEILGVSKDSTDADIKKNYRKLAKEFHPDKNPEAGEKFKEISFAYEVLSDPEKRKTYDRFGIKGLQDGSDSFSDASDFFAQWFPFGQAHGGHGHGPSGSGRGKAAHIMVKLEVTLEEIYNGNVSKTVEYQRTEHCEACNAQGGPKEAIEKCTTCGGSGRTASYHFVGLSAFESVCQSCSGRGTTIKADMQCTNCAGVGLREQKQTREITIDKGAPNMMKIPFASEGNQPITGERGDVVVMLIQKEHPVFMRRHNDLFLRNIRVNLTQALCGYVHVFQHLDGRNICIRNNPGDVIRHGDMKVVPGEGMPLRNNPFEKGDLFVEFRVVFPENNFATPESLKVLEKLLPPREPFIMPKEAEEVQLIDAQPFGEEQGAGAHGIDDDDDDFEAGPHIEGVQCQTT